MKRYIFTFLVVVLLMTASIGPASAQLTSCSDTRLTCYAFCSDGPRTQDTSIGRCYNWSLASCDVEKCSGDPCDRSRNHCDSLFAYDKSCVVVTGNYYATWCYF